MIRDIFLSYKHSKYTREAAELLNMLETTKGFSCFFDRRDSLWTLSDKDLRQYLADALNAARAVVFFETFSEAVLMLAMQSGGKPKIVDGGVRPSWQQWELRQADPNRYLVLYHSAYPRALQLGLNGSVDMYDDLLDAADQIADHLGFLPS